MTTIAVTQTLLVDLVPLAEEFEHTLAQYLLPLALGFYLPGKADPVMREGQYYYQLVDGKEVAVQKLEDIKQDVYDAKHDVVVPAKRIHQLTYGPRMPVRGMGMVRAIIDTVLDANAAWTKQRNRGLLDAVTPFLNPDILAPNNAEAYSYVSEKISTLTSELRTNLIDFIGEDQWIMHFQKDWGMAGAIVEKTIDYRIHDWNLRMQSGEWK